jgi:hypothetical protein
VAEEGQVIEALAAIGSIGTVGLAAALVVLAFKALHAKDETAACRDLLDAQKVLTSEAKSKLDISVVNEAVTASKLLQETTLRKSVEAQRDEAQQRTRAYLSFVMANAEQSVIDEAIADLFSAGRPGSVPQPKAATAPRRTDPDALLDPDA